MRVFRVQAFIHAPMSFISAKQGESNEREAFCQLIAKRGPAAQKRRDHVGVLHSSFIGHMLACHACRVSFPRNETWRLAINCLVYWLHVVSHSERSLQPAQRQLAELQQNLDAIIVSNEEDEGEITVAS